MKKWIFLLFWLTACSDDEEQTLVRITNGSDEVLDEVSLPTINGSKPLGSLTPGSTSRYLEPAVPPNKFLHLFIRIGNDTIPPTFEYANMLPPTPLPPGFYTYEVALYDVNGEIHYSTQLLNN